MTYIPEEKRYDSMEYRRCGKSGLLLPAIALGLWHNFGDITPLATQRAILTTAFDNGITHFDLANNYGPPYGAAEKNFGVHYQADWKPHRDELIISSKAGYDMWKGPYGNHGSRKYLIASCDQSLKRTGLDYFDIFYHHRPDPDTPIEETMQALDYIVRSGRALYVGISNYNAEQAAEAAKVLKQLGTPLLVNQVKYSMFSRWPEDGLMDTLEQNGVGMTAFSPLAGGLLTAKYSAGIPADSRAKTDPRFLAPDRINPADVEKARKLAVLAAERGDTPSQLALRWVLRNPVMTCAIIGASKPEQVLDNIGVTRGTPLSDEELAKIDEILNG